MSRMDDVKSDLKYCGEGVLIYPWAKIVNRDKIEMGDYCQIDDFSFVNGGLGLKMGKYVHIGSLAAIIGAGTCTMDDCAALCAGAKIITSSNIYDEAWSMSDVAPEMLLRYKTGHVEVGAFAFIGVNSVVYPDVEIGEGAVIGALSFVNKDVEPWSINVGSPCRKIKDRPKPSYPVPEEFGIG